MTSVAPMNNSIIIQLPVLHKAVSNETKVTTPPMPALQLSLLVNNNNKKICPAAPPKENETHPLAQQQNSKDDSSEHQIQNAELPPLEVPLLPSWLKRLDPPQYTCDDCGDSFLYESNLRCHLRRRSVRIKFPCAVCKSSLTYFNRCALLAHVRDHLEDPDLEKVAVTPLDRDSLLLEKEDSDTTNGTDEIPEVEKRVARGRFRCSECFEYLVSAIAREEHYSPLQPGAFACSKCSVVCPSHCSLEAHKRIHLQIHPYVCPECGRDESDWAVFQRHLDGVCFHRSRTLGYKCMLCDELEISASVQPHKHMLTAHSEAYYKCQACPMAFKGPSSFNTHKKLVHPSRGEVPCKTIFKCPLCDTVFHSREQLIGHLNMHIKDEKVQMQPIFTCPQCSARCRTRALLKSHFEECHHLIEESKEDIVVEESEEPFLPPKVDVDGSVECKMCHQVFHNIRGYNIHSGRRHSRRGFLCVLCGMTLRDLKTLFSHEQEHLVKGELLCMLCHVQKADKIELNSHLQKHVNRFKFPYTCTFCEETLDDYVSALKHVGREHHLNPPSSSTTRRTSHRNGPDQSSSDSKPTSLPPIKIRIPLQFVRQHSEEAADSRSLSPTPVKTYTIPTKKLRLHEDGSVYICAKCDFQTPEQKEFHKHIQFHRKHPSSLQCPDCGTCFVVETTLRKHLKVAHRVADIDGYLEKSGLVRKNGGGQSMEVEDQNKSNSRQCTICYQNFETDSSLKSHMRSHGMAFIRSRASYS